MVLYSPARCGDDRSRESEAFRACSKAWWFTVLCIPGSESDKHENTIVNHILRDCTSGIAQSAQLDQLETRLSIFQDDVNQNMRLIIDLLRGNSPPDTGVIIEGNSSPDRSSLCDTLPGKLTGSTGARRDDVLVHQDDPLGPTPSRSQIASGGKEIKRDSSFDEGISITRNYLNSEPSLTYAPISTLAPTTRIYAQTSSHRSITPSIPSSSPPLKRALNHILDGGNLSDPIAKRLRTQAKNATEEPAAFGAIPLEHIQGLQEIVGERTASFRSNDQYEVFCSLLGREQHVLHVSRTGGGKTLPFQLALKYWDPSIKGIMVLPYVVLYQQFKDRFDRVGLPAQICNAREMLDPNARVYIVGLNQFLSPKLQLSFGDLAATQRLGAVMFDEVDGAVVDSDFRPHFRWSIEKALQLPNTVCLFASATVPSRFEDQWFLQLSLMSAVRPGHGDSGHQSKRRSAEDTPAIRVVRSRSTERLNIIYRIRTYASRKEDLNNALSDAVAQGSHTLVYVVKHDSVKEVGHMLHTGKQIHGKTSLMDRKKHMKGLGEGACSILVGNKAAYYGLDVPNVDHVIFLIEWGSLAPRLVEFVQAAGRAGRNGKLATVTILAPEYGPQSEPPRSWTDPEPSDFGGRGELVRMIKGSMCIRSVLSAHMDGWSNMTCVNMNRQLSQGRDQEPVVYVAPCSRCEVNNDGLQPCKAIAWVPLVPQAIPKTWAAAIQMTRWSEWVEGSHLASPSIVNASPTAMTTRGIQRLPSTGQSIQKVFEIFKAKELESLRGQQRVEQILRLVGPSCVVCISMQASSSPSNHLSTKCQRFPAHQPASRATLPNLAGPNIAYQGWKRAWANSIVNAKVHGICFTCMLPETGGFHTFNSGASGKEKACMYADVVPPLAWHLRRTRAFRERLNNLSGGRVDTTDCFDYLTFAIAHPHRGPPTTDGACALLRLWYNLERDKQGWKILESEEMAKNAMNDVLIGME